MPGKVIIEQNYHLYTAFIIHFDFTVTEPQK